MVDRSEEFSLQVRRSADFLHRPSSSSDDLPIGSGGGGAKSSSSSSSLVGPNGGRGVISLQTVGVANSGALKPKSALTEFLNTAHRLSIEIESNEKIVSKLEQLVKRQEAWSDHSNAVATLSQTFMVGLGKGKADLEVLKRLYSAQGQVTRSRQHTQHYKEIVDSLANRLKKLEKPCQDALKLHQEQVKRTESRELKYGATKTLDSPMRDAQSFALFDKTDSALRRRSSNINGNSNSSNSSRGVLSYGNGNNSNGSSNSSVGGGSSLMVESEEFYSKTSKKATPYGESNSNSNNSTPTSTNSSNNGSNTSIGSNNGGGGYNRNANSRSGPTLAMATRQRTENKLDQASKIEATVAQMGELFKNLASLVSEQSEQITSIEENVEDGLSETKEAHTLMLSFYEITKGNRSIILKIFALLILCILLFLVKWR